MFAYDSITVSSAWELISVSMCYSKGDGVNTPLSRFMHCTHDKFLPWCEYKRFFLCGVFDYLPWDGHVLPGTKLIKIMCFTPTI